MQQEEVSRSDGGDKKNKKIKQTPRNIHTPHPCKVLP